MPVNRRPTEYARLREAGNTSELEDYYELRRHSSMLSEATNSQSSILQHRLDGITECSTFRQKFRSQTSGWRGGAIAAAFTAASVLILNTSVTIWVISNRRFRDDADGLRVISEGKCNTIKDTSRWVHLVINTLSTLLLAGSNYLMQVLCSPTLEELKRAHTKRTWLHIGVPNTRNLWHIDRGRSLICFLLFFSSVPLHLAFNSVIFAEVQANNYMVMPVTDAFYTGGGYDTSGFIGANDSITQAVLDNASRIRERFQSNASATKRLDTSDCLDAYNNQYISRYGDVLLFQDDVIWHYPNEVGLYWANSSHYWNNTGSPCSDCANSADFLPFTAHAKVFPSNGWVCPSRSITNCTLEFNSEVPDKSSWAPYGSPVLYCLAELVKEQCKLQFSPWIATAVITCNAVKAFCMLFILFRYHDRFLVTLGDTIAALLEQPDPETERRCLCEKHCFQLDWDWKEKLHSFSCPLTEDVRRDVMYKSRGLSWGRASSNLRWHMTYLMYSAAIIVAGISIHRTMVGMPKDVKGLWTTGFGELKGNNLLGMSTSTIGAIFLANTPQLVLSYLYVCYNALYTCMFVQREFVQYSRARKPLRVTAPVGQQRSTFWLQLPYRYAVPLMGLSALLHWLASQSLFMVSITVFENYDDEKGIRRTQNAGRISTCGYSPVAIILTTCVGCVIAVGGLVLAARRYPPGVPLVSSCSAAISAACHPPMSDGEAALLPVQWGVVWESDESDQFGHVTLTSFPVKRRTASLTNKH